MLRHNGKDPSLSIEKNILEFLFYLYPTSGSPNIRSLEEKSLDYNNEHWSEEKV